MPLNCYSFGLFNCVSAADPEVTEGNFACNPPTGYGGGGLQNLNNFECIGRGSLAAWSEWTTEFTVVVVAILAVIGAVITWLLTHKQKCKQLFGCGDDDSKIELDEDSAA